MHLLDYPTQHGIHARRLLAIPAARPACPHDGSSPRRTGDTASARASSGTGRRGDSQRHLLAAEAQRPRHPDQLLQKLRDSRPVGSVGEPSFRVERLPAWAKFTSQKIATRPSSRSSGGRSWTRVPPRVPPTRRPRRPPCGCTPRDRCRAGAERSSSRGCTRATPRSARRRRIVSLKPGFRIAYDRHRRASAERSARRPARR
mgnify:CR=1 FL=1